MRAIRWSILPTLGLLAACSHQDQPTANQTSVAAPSTAAIEAQRTAQHYFDLIQARRFADAYRLWDTATMATVTPADFAAGQRLFTRYEGKAGTPSAIRTVSNEDFVLVEATAHAILQSGQPSDRDGVVMLKRATATNQMPTGPWRIWGVDVRERHCRPGEKPVGLGCSKLSQK